MKLRFTLGLVFFALSWAGCSTVATKPKSEISVQTKGDCSEYYSKDTDDLFSAEISESVLEAKRDFDQSKFLPNGKIFGASVKGFVLDRRSVADIDQEMKDKSCLKSVNVVKSPKDNKPVLLPDGRTIPLWVYLCNDGGFVRIKPEGDPTNKFLPMPHGSKGLRYPYDSKFENFSDEVLKVNDRGQAIPKWPKDMRVPEADKQNFLNCWSEDAHKILRAN